MLDGLQMEGLDRVVNLDRYTHLVLYRERSGIVCLPCLACLKMVLNNTRARSSRA